MNKLFDKIHNFMNNVKGFTVGYSATDHKMLFEFDGKRYVAEFREIENPKDDIIDDMRRIKYL
jgi:hypothetical protein